MIKSIFMGFVCVFLFCVSACHDELSSFQNSVLDDEQMRSSQILEANGFNIIQEPEFTVLQLFENRADGVKIIAEEFLLLRMGEGVPTQYKNLPLINIPITSLITSSTTQISLLNALQGLDKLVAHVDQFVWDAQLSDKLTSAQIATVGVSANLNTEIVLNLNPDVYMAVTNDDAHAFPLLTQAGIVILPNAEYLEQTLLGRAEWIKVMGLLLDKEELADQLFMTMRESYYALKLLVANVEKKPLILPNSPFRGTWYVPGGKSYIAQLIQDAGGDYSWQNNNDTASLVISFEQMLILGLEADIWINPVSSQARLADVLDIDSRLGDMRPFKRGEVYNFTRRIAENGANDYWESGVVNPDKILADLIKIFHPELLPDYDFFYYRQLR